MKRKNLKLLTFFTFLFAIVITGGIFAYWASNVAGDETSANPQIVIGVGQEAKTTLNLQEFSRTQGVLVPIGYEKEGSVSKIEITYDVLLQATDTGADGAVFNLNVSHETLPHELLVVVIEPLQTQIVAGGQKVNVKITVTLTEPENVEQYNEVANKTFEIGLTFSATA